MTRLKKRERGASMVEFALVLPLFLLLLFGIMESGWLFSQLTETRNAAREGARLAVVDYGSATQVALATCNRAVLSQGGATVDVSTSGNISDPINDPTASVTVTIDNQYESLTGFLDPFFQGRSLDATVTMRVERPLVALSGTASELCP